MYSEFDSWSVFANTTKYTYNLLSKTHIVCLALDRRFFPFVIGRVSGGVNGRVSGGVNGRVSCRVNGGQKTLRTLAYIQYITYSEGAGQTLASMN